MSEKLYQCCDRLKEEIKTVEIYLKDIGGHLISSSEAGLEEIETRLKHAVTRCEAKREHAASAGQRVRQFIERKKSEVVSRFEDWKTDREIEKLEKHADRLDDQAVDAIVVAAYAVLEAEVAIVEALKARKIAIEVAG